MPGLGHFNAIEPRLEAKLLPPDARGCHIWTGEKLRAGRGFVYGAIWFEGKRRLLHRVVFYVHNGYWSNVTRHTCDVPLCGEYTHLIDGTQADNVHDAISRGRASAPPHYTGEDHGTAKLTWAQVEAIRSEYVPRKVSQRFLAAKYGVSQPLIGYIVRGEIWSQPGGRV